MSAIDRADVLALLEERPYQLEELVALFEQPAEVVTRAMVDFEIPRCEKCRAAFLFRPGHAGRFCTRTCYASTPPKPRAPGVNKGGRKPWVDHTVRHEAILQAIAGGPLGIHPLSERAQLTLEQTKKACRQLLHQGRIKLIAPAGRRTWAWTLSSPSGSAPSHAVKKSEATRSTRVGEEGRVYPRDVAARELEDLDQVDQDLAEIDPDLEPLEREPPTVKVRSLKSVVRTHDARGRQLRQVEGKTPAAEPSWWCGKTREQFAAAAHARDAEMSEKSNEWRRQSVKGLAINE